MNLNYLLYFQTLAKYEHYGKAAEELHITQPSLSKAIRNLEQDLGVELFEKSGRGIRLSSQGVHYLDYVDKALHELRLGNDILRYEKASFDAFVPIGLVLPAASSVFSRWVKDFQAGFRGKVFFSCKNGTTKQLVLALKNGSVDFHGSCPSGSARTSLHGKKKRPPEGTGGGELRRPQPGFCPS